MKLDLAIKCGRDIIGMGCESIHEGEYLGEIIDFKDGVVYLPEGKEIKITDWADYRVVEPLKLKDADAIEREKRAISKAFGRSRSRYFTHELPEGG